MYNWSLLLDIITYTSRLIVVTPNWGVIFLRAVELGDKLSEVQEEMRKTKLMLDKDCIFFWRIFQDIFKNDTVNFTGLLVVPNISREVSEKIVCSDCSDFTIFRHQLESDKQFHGWAKTHLKGKKALDSNTFVDVVTRLNALYVLFETPQQNIETAPKVLEEEEEENSQQQGESVVKHVSKVLMTPQQFEILTSNIRHRVLFGEYGSGKTQVLIERVRQIAWEMHFNKTNSVIYLFSFADVEVCNLSNLMEHFSFSSGEWKAESERVLTVPFPDVHQQEIQRHRHSAQHQDYLHQRPAAP